MGQNSMELMSEGHAKCTRVKICTTWLKEAIKKANLNCFVNPDWPKTGNVQSDLWSNTEKKGGTWIQTSAANCLRCSVSMKSPHHSPRPFLKWEFANLNLFYSEHMFPTINFGNCVNFLLKNTDKNDWKPDCAWTKHVLTQLEMMSLKGLTLNSCFCSIKYNDLSSLLIILCMSMRVCVCMNTPHISPLRYWERHWWRELVTDQMEDGYQAQQEVRAWWFPYVVLATV